MGSLRAGCLLTLDPESKGEWRSVARSGERVPIDSTADAALEYTRRAASTFGVGNDRRVAFDKRLAVQDAKANNEGTVMPGSLLIAVRFVDGRYHGREDRFDGADGWPPSPGRLFQALVAGAARGANPHQDDVRALKWLDASTRPASRRSRRGAGGRSCCSCRTTISTRSAAIRRA